MVTHTGTPGWSYGHWDGVLYPHATPARDRLGCTWRRPPPWTSTPASTAGRRRHAGRVVPTTAGRVRDVGQDASRPDPRRAAVRPGDVGGAARGRLVRARRSPGRPARAAGPRPRARRSLSRPLPRWPAVTDASCARVPTRRLGRRRRVRHPGTT